MPSTRPRFRLRTLLLLVAFVAVVSFSFVRPSFALSACIASCVAFLVTTALPIACIGQGGARAFCLGFGIVGVVHLFATDKVSSLSYSVDIARSLARNVGLEPYGPDGWSLAMIIESWHTLLAALVAGYFCRWVWERGRQEE